MSEVLESLKNWFVGRGRVVVAFSGGVDSSLVTKIAHLVLDGNAVAVTAYSPSMSESELGNARDVAYEIGIRHLIVCTKEFVNPRYIVNLPDRCYFCKKELSVELVRLASDMGYNTIVDGTNAEDLKGHRPGAAATREGGILSPLAELNIGKEAARELSRSVGLSTSDKPAMACLSSRIEYGQRITVEDLRRVSEAERLVRKVTSAQQIRVRVHGSLARIELSREERSLFFDEEILDTVHAYLNSLGFTYVTFDLLGYRSGSMLGRLVEKTPMEDGTHPV